MSESVSLPALGESVTEGTVTRWLKSVGDRVEVDEPLLEVSTDKVDTEIPSPVAGVIEEILVEEDETVEVGAPLVKIGDGEGASGGSDDSSSEEMDETSGEQTENASPAESDADTAKPSTEAESAEEAPAPAEPEKAPAEKSEEPAEKPAASDEKPSEKQEYSAPASSSANDDAASGDGSQYVTPIVRKLANEQGVDLSSVTGTGVGGRIRKEDVLEAAEKAKQQSQAPAAASQQAPQTTSAPAAAPKAEVSDLRGTTVEMSRLRKVVAERAVQSMQSTAQLTTVVKADVTKVAALRARVKDDFQRKTGTKLSFLPFFALAATEALKTYPIINATVDGSKIVYPGYENVSIAVDTERGLLTPVVKNAGDLNISGFARQIADLAERTRNNQLKPDELAGGTFTLTNTGSRGALFDTPVVFLPQSAILGTGAVVKEPAVVSVDGQDAIQIRSIVYLALSYDHRIIDGADAARFLSLVKARLEEANFEGNLGI